MAEKATVFFVLVGLVYLVASSAYFLQAGQKSEPFWPLCTPPYIAKGFSCCIDLNSDRTCDTDQMTKPSKPTQPPTERFPPFEKPLKKDFADKPRVEAGVNVDSIDMGVVDLQEVRSGEVLRTIEMMNVGKSRLIFSADRERHYFKGNENNLEYGLVVVPRDFELLPGEKRDVLVRMYDKCKADNGSYRHDFWYRTNDPLNPKFHIGIVAVFTNSPKGAGCAEKGLCIETDGGKDYYADGNVYGVCYDCEDKGTGANSDFCVDDFSLTEFYCVEWKGWAREEVICTDGCEDGACVK